MHVKKTDIRGLKFSPVEAELLDGQIADVIDHDFSISL